MAPVPTDDAGQATPATEVERTAAAARRARALWRAGEQSGSIAALASLPGSPSVRSWMATGAEGSSRTGVGGPGQEKPLPEGDGEPIPEPGFSDPARRLWEGIDPSIRFRILNNVWCNRCRRSSSIQLLDARVKRGDLLLTGLCTVCGGNVARVVERA